MAPIRSGRARSCQNCHDAKTKCVWDDDGKSCKRCLEKTWRVCETRGDKRTKPMRDRAVKKNGQRQQHTAQAVSNGLAVAAAAAAAGRGEDEEDDPFREVMQRPALTRYFTSEPVDAAAAASGRPAPPREVEVPPVSVPARVNVFQPQQTATMFYSQPAPSSLPTGIERSTSVPSLFGEISPMSNSSVSWPPTPQDQAGRAPPLFDDAGNNLPPPSGSRQNPIVLDSIPEEKDEAAVVAATENQNPQSDQERMQQQIDNDPLWRDISIAKSPPLDPVEQQPEQQQSQPQLQDPRFCADNLLASPGLVEQQQQQPEQQLEDLSLGIRRVLALLASSPRGSSPSRGGG